jgi:hypothetical protein
MSDEARDASLGALESQLTSLTPQPSSLDRDYLLYHAGRASVRQGWFWQAATGFLVLVVAALSMALLYRPIQRSEPLVVERVVYVPAERPATTASPTPANIVSVARAGVPDQSQLVAELDRRADAENLHRRDQIFRFGIESAPEPRPSRVVEKALPLDPLLGLPASSLDDGSSRLLLRSSRHLEN